MKRLLRNVLAAFVVSTVGVVNASAQASYNFSYTQGETVAAGSDYFLYNIGSGQFLTSGLNYGTRATIDNSGRVLTLAANGSGYSIYTNYVSLNNRTDAKAGYLTTNGYVDTGTNDAAWVFTPVTVSGYTNAYTIKNSDTQYLYFDAANTDPGCPVNVGNNTGNNYSYWLLIPKATREAAGDYSHYLINTQMNCAWEFKTWCGVTGWNDNSGVVPGGNPQNRCGEKYHTVKDIYQDVKETLPNGRYKLHVQGFWRQDGSSAGPVLYANSDTKTMLQRTGSENDMNAASTSFTAGLYDGNNVETFVNNGSLRVGINITANSQWVIFDNFVLQYLGQCVMDYAQALPAGGMTADTWYYFDIAVAGDYTLTATDLSAIKYTTDGYTLTRATPTDSWSSANQTLAAGRYYVKSSSAQTLSVEAASYTYTVGTATADKAYIQPGQTVTITYPDAVTNDGDASFAIQGTPSITLGSTAIEPTVTAKGFTFTVPSGLTNGTTYMLSIPAGALGYAAGHTFNEAQQIALTTTALYDGVYFLKAAKATTDTSFASCDDTDAAGKYLSRGGAWGTHATLDKYGLAFQISTNGENFSVLKVYDTQRFFFNADDPTYQMWADGTGGTADNEKFVIENRLNYLAIKPYRFRDNPYFLKVNTGEQALDIIPVYADGPVAGPIILFTAETPSDHATAMAALKDAQATTAASAAVADNSTAYGSLSGVTSVSAMETAVSSLDNFVVVGGNAPTSVQEKYQGSQPNPAPETVYSSTLTIPAPGLYRFSMQAFYRAASNANTQAMHTDGADFSPVVLFFDNAETQIKSLYDENGGATAYVEGNDAQYNSMYYANNMPGALKMFQEGKYKNDVWFYAPAAGEYTYGVKYMGFANANMQWFIYSPEAVTVTYYGDGTITAANGVVTVLGNNELTAINNALTSDIAVLNIEGAVGLSNASISTTNNPNLLIYANSGQVSNSNNVIVDGTCENLVLSKQSNPFFVPKAFTATDATYTVRPTDLADGQFATLMIPFEAYVPTGTAYTLDQGVNVLGDNVNATEITTVVPANSPVLITGSGQFTASNVNVDVIAKDATYTNGELVGVYSTTQAPVSSYVLQNHSSSPNGVAFYRVADTQPNVGPFRAYIKAQGSSVKSRALYINFGGDATGIATLDAEGNVSLSSAEYYTAGGTRLSAPQKGLNIVKYGNGTVKKIFVK